MKAGHGKFRHLSRVVLRRASWPERRWRLLWTVATAMWLAGAVAISIGTEQPDAPGIVVWLGVYLAPLLIYAFGAAIERGSRADRG
jgi:hypothetical protein